VVRVEHRVVESPRRLAPVSYRYTLRTTDANDVGAGMHTTDRWLRVGDEFDEAGQRWRVVDRYLAPETDPEYVAAILLVERTRRPLQKWAHPSPWTNGNGTAKTSPTASASSKQR
jgi:hypothetical protein